MFGFQLSNIIPGFPRAKMYFVSPPYELSESQACENGQVSRNDLSRHGAFHLLEFTLHCALFLKFNKLTKR